MAYKIPKGREIRCRTHYQHTNKRKDYFNLECGGMSDKKKVKLIEMEMKGKISPFQLTVERDGKTIFKTNDVVTEMNIDEMTTPRYLLKDFEKGKSFFILPTQVKDIHTRNYGEYIRDAEDEDKLNLLSDIIDSEIESLGFEHYPRSLMLSATVRVNGDRDREWDFIPLRCDPDTGYCDVDLVFKNNAEVKCSKHRVMRSTTCKA